MKKAIKFNTGCSGFYNAHWKKVFYPEKLPASKWFGYYSEHLNAIEINSTFYHFPLLKTVQNWHDKSPEDFRFSIKAPKLITHMKKLHDCKELFNDLYEVCEQGLKNKLGCILFQFPPSFSYTAARMELITSGLNPHFKNIVEFRHESWWQQEVYDVLAKNKITFCSINHPKLPETIITNTPLAYVRLHGNPRLFYSEYTMEQLTHLYTTLTKKPKLKEAWVFFNNTAGINGIINAQQFQQLNTTLHEH